MVYSITYDLKKPGKNYDDLYDAIKKLGSWSHYLDSTWLVSTHHSATEINDKLKTIIDKNDSLFISEVTKNNTGWMSQDFWNWLNEHL